MNAVIALTDLLLQEKSTLNIEQIEHLEVIQTSGSHLLTVNYNMNINIYINICIFHTYIQCMPFILNALFIIVIYFIDY